MSLLVWLLTAATLVPSDEARLLECLAQLEERDARRVELCLEELRAEPDASLRLALAQWDELGLLSRRRLARLLAELGSAELSELAIALTKDGDLEVRRSLLAFLARREHADRALDVRVAQLSALASNDEEAQLREEALRALPTLDAAGGFAQRALEEQLVASGQAERRLAAALFGAMPSARARVLALVQEAFAKPRESQLDTEVLALLLPAYGRALAETSGAGGTALERAPMIHGAAHPAPHVRRGARACFETWITRMRAFGNGARTERILIALAAEGFGKGVALDQRIRIALSWGEDPQAAIVAARELQDLAEPLRSVQDRALLARALYLESLAIMASGSNAPQLLERSGKLLDSLLAERTDLSSKDLSGLHADALRLRAMVDLTQALAKLAGGTGSDDSAVLEHMRRVHSFSLEIQKTDLRAARGGSDSVDTILGGALSPLVLLFASGESGAWPVTRGLAAQRLVGEALAAVAPRELPGFHATGQAALEVVGPLDDAERFGHLLAIRGALLASLDEWIEELRKEPDSPELQGRILQLRQRKLILMREQREAGQTGEWKFLLDQRSPSSLALWHVRDLRAEGKTGESRALAEATRASLEETGQYQNNSILAAEIEMAIGTSWSDEDEPQRAERELTKALERLEALQTTQEERGGDPRAIASIRGLRSEALVSLAVNANVKLRDQARALGYFERAYELRQDEFMTVLLACYRARSGNEAEARAALARVVVGPGLYYNLACTWALLGEQELAFDFLRREFEENHPSVDSRNRQREWAEKDPDLESLRDEPRFRALIERE